MTNLKKYGLAIALAMPVIFTATNKAEAAKAVKNNDRANAVNVRSEAKESNNIIGTINNDKTYEVIENQGLWLKIKFDGKEAFVGSYWFNIVEEAKVTSPVNFRKDDNLNSKIYQVLDEGDVVEAISFTNNGYVKVIFNGKEGYVHQSHLSLPESFVTSNNSEATYKENTQTTYQNSNNSYSQAQTENYQSSNYTYNQAQNYQQPVQNSSAKEIIAQRESGGSYNARNGQYIGRYQLSSSYLNGDYSPANQERVADQYVSQRYGSWDNALAFWNNNGWY